MIFLCFNTTILTKIYTDEIKIAFNKILEIIQHVGEHFELILSRVTYLMASVTEGVMRTTAG